MSPSFAIIIPMYDEQAGAAECVRAVCAQLERLENRSVLVTVNDGSRDRTGEILEQLRGKTPRYMPLTHAVNQGYGAALRTAAKWAHGEGYEYALFMDSDLTNDPADIPRFAEQMRAGTDVIKATRYSLGGRAQGVPLYRVAISACGNRIARMLFRLPIHDCTNGFRAVRLELLMRMALTENRFPLIMEELYWAKFLGASFIEIPVTLKKRGPGLRATSFVYRPRVFYDYLKYPVRACLGVQPDASRKRGKR